MMPAETSPYTDIRPGRLRGIDILLRLAFIGALTAGIASAFLYAGGWFSPRTLSPARMVDAFEIANGKHPGFRRNHAKGVSVAGYFESNGQGVLWSKAVFFIPGRIPVTGRFALAGGAPYQADAPLKPIFQGGDLPSEAKRRSPPLISAERGRR
jgi:catalase